jgi:hypothetical protein
MKPPTDDILDEILGNVAILAFLAVWILIEVTK